MKITHVSDRVKDASEGSYVRMTPQQMNISSLAEKFLSEHSNNFTFNEFNRQNSFEISLFRGPLEYNAIKTPYEILDIMVFEPYLINNINNYKKIMHRIESEYTKFTKTNR